MMDLSSLIRIVPDFPKAGISFKDITTLIKNGPAFQQAIEQLAAACQGRGIDLVVGPEARGFIIGAPLAYRLGVGFVPVRKAGKLPAETIKSEYQLEYGHDSLEIHRDAIKPGDRVLVVDDLLATGGTIKASIDLVERLGGVVTTVAFLIELTDLKGRENLKQYDVLSVIQYNI